MILLFTLWALELQQLLLIAFSADLDGKHPAYWQLPSLLLRTRLGHFDYYTVGKVLRFQPFLFVVA